MVSWRGGWGSTGSDSVGGAGGAPGAGRSGARPCGVRPSLATARAMGRLCPPRTLAPTCAERVAAHRERGSAERDVGGGDERCGRHGA